MEKDHVLEDDTVTFESDILLEETMNDESTQFAEPNSKSGKRGREEDDDETWTEVRNRKERRREIRESVEIYVTAKDTFPKQFALAKLFKSQNIKNVSKVKYINPYKIAIEFTNESSAEYFINCQHFLELEWRFQRPFEVGLSYGVIKNIELDLSEKELTECITSTYEIISIKRLKRRVRGTVGWTDSESVRIGFKGPNVPPHIAIFDMKIKVEPYSFPVTQCSRCWRFGHTSRLCPSKRVHCPKCGENHESCDVKLYKCINCKNDHMALDKTCPVFLKEKKIRDIMTEFNVTYRKATTMYVQPTPIPTYTRPASTSAFPALPSKGASFPSGTSRYFEFTSTVDEAISYAQVTSPPHRVIEAQAGNTTHQTSTNKKRNKKKKPNKSISDNTITDNLSVSDSESDKSDRVPKHKRKRSRRDYISFSLLLEKIKNVIFQSDEAWKCRIENVMHLCLEWITSCIFEYIPSLPFLRKIFE